MTDEEEVSKLATELDNAERIGEKARRLSARLRNAKLADMTSDALVSLISEAASMIEAMTSTPSGYLDYPDGWVFAISLDSEGGRFGGDAFSTRELAIAAGIEEFKSAGETFATGYRTVHRECAPFPSSADALIDGLEHDEWDEALHEQFIDAAFVHAEDLDKRLEQTWSKWCDDHDIHVDAIYLTLIQTHQSVTPEERAEHERRLLDAGVARGENADV